MSSKQMFTRIGMLMMACALVAPTAIPQSGDQRHDKAEVLLEAARHKQLVDGDLEAAIRDYKAILAAYASNHPVAAKALVEMGECYEKLGQGEAQKAYEQVLRDYADQSAEASEARTRLAALEHGGTRSTGDRAVWTGMKVDGFGTISPDGRFLTYIDWGGTGGLVLRDLVAGTDRRLTAGTWADGFAQFSAISRDGTQVVYQWWLNDKKRYELRIASLHGTGVPTSRLLFSRDDVVSPWPYDWSADGKWIAVGGGREDSTGIVGVLNAENGSLRILKSVGGWEGQKKIIFSPDGQYIAYDLPAGENTNNTDMFITAIDGSRDTVVAKYPSENVIMGWSPQGYLLFASDRSGSMGLWSVQVANGRQAGEATLVKPDIGTSWSLGLTSSGTMYVWKPASPHFLEIASIDLDKGKLLTNPQGSSRHYIVSRGQSDFSGDGKELAFVSCTTLGAGPCSLFIQSVESGQIRELHPRLMYFAYPRLSPDGRSAMVFGWEKEGHQGIYLIDTGTGKVSLVIAADAQSQPRDASWSADGHSIFYRVRSATEMAHRQGPDALVIVKRDLTTGEEHELLHLPMEGGKQARVSRDGQNVAILSEGGKTILSVVPMTSGTPRVLLSAATQEQIVFGPVIPWTADSRALLVVKTHRPDPTRRELWLVPVDGSAPRKLDINIENWAIGQAGFSLSPDGHHIAFAAAAGKLGYEVWALENFLPALKAAK